jgi:hypothetical protein
MNTETHTITLAILDDLNFDTHHTKTIEGPLTYETILSSVETLVASFKNQTDISGYFDSDYFGAESEYNGNISSKLFSDGYWVRNRYNKYYVICFSIDHTRFEIFSKDCDKELIDWGKDNGEIKGLIEDPEYNENPVITVLRMFENI